MNYLSESYAAKADEADDVNVAGMDAVGRLGVAIKRLDKCGAIIARLRTAFGEIIRLSEGGPLSEIARKALAESDAAP